MNEKRKKKIDIERLLVDAVALAIENGQIKYTRPTMFGAARVAANQHSRIQETFAEKN